MRLTVFSVRLKTLCLYDALLGLVHTTRSTRGSGDQNETIIEAIAASTKRFSGGGYEVYVDGVIGPWFLAPWIKLAEDGIDVRYIVLRPDEQTTISRALEREQRDYFPLNRESIINVWRSLSELGK